MIVGSHIKKEIKNCLPTYKMVYSICFVVFLALVRGISAVDEIGIAMLSNMAFLAIVFCADVYEMEFRENRWEVFILLPFSRRVKAIRQRLLIETCYLSILASLGYVCFYWQRPRRYLETPDGIFFGMFLAAVMVTIFFFGILSMTMVSMCNHLWAGIGLSVVLWQVLSSKRGEAILGKFNVFAFSFRDTTNTDMYSEWLPGSIVALLLAVIMYVCLPKIMKREDKGKWK